MPGRRPDMDASTGPGCQTFPVHRWKLDTLQSVEDQIAQEVPIALVYNGMSFAVMMATPLDLEDFALGFSLSEEIIESPSQVHRIQTRQHEYGLELQILIDAECMTVLKQRARNLTGRTGCGLCGAQSLAEAIRPTRAVTRRAAPGTQAIQTAIGQLETAQPLQSITGALHGAAWCDDDGNIGLVREDVGRHNALDKLLGALACTDIKPEYGFILVSSRASYEMVQKTCRAAVPTLIAVSAPTTLAIQLALQAGLNLIGFAHKGQYVIYTPQESSAS